MVMAEITIYARDGQAVWHQTKANLNVLEALDYVAAIRSTVMSVFLTKGGHMIDQQIYDPDCAAADNSC
jgi:hypothetical protein